MIRQLLFCVSVVGICSCRLPYEDQFKNHYMGKALLGPPEPQIVRSCSGEPLYDAAERGDVEAVRRLLEGGANVNLRLPKSSACPGWTPLMISAAEGKLAVVNELLLRGADPNIQNERSGRTALIFAARYGFQEIAEALLVHGADPCLADRQEFTPYRAAMEAGQSGMTKLLRRDGRCV